MSDHCSDLEYGRGNDANNIAASLSSIEHYQCILNRRQRGEKRPIPDEQKDEKYFERRKRNNEAAKKSRDARKMREDRVSDNFIQNAMNGAKSSELEVYSEMSLYFSQSNRLHFGPRFLNKRMLFFGPKF